MQHIIDSTISEFRETYGIIKAVDQAIYDADNFKGKYTFDAKTEPEKVYNCFIDDFNGLINKHIDIINSDSSMNPHLALNRINTLQSCLIDKGSDRPSVKIPNLECLRYAKCLDETKDEYLYKIEAGLSKIQTHYTSAYYEAMQRKILELKKQAFERLTGINTSQLIADFKKSIDVSGLKTGIAMIQKSLEIIYK